MTYTKKCLVGALGLLEHEVSLLKSIIKISSNREHIPYEFIQDDLSEAHIILATIDNESAMETWQQLAKGNNVPVLLAITPKDLGKFPGYSFSRPFSPSKVLSVLDQIVKTSLSSLFDDGIFHRKNLANQLPPSNLDASSTEMHRALVVDDSKTVLSQLTHELANHHIRAEVAETGEQALSLIDHEDYDIIFLDIVLPGMDGYQVCKNLKRNPEKKHIPVIMLTSKSSPFDKVRGSMSGCNAYLTKPVDIGKFHDILDEYLP